MEILWINLAIVFSLALLARYFATPVLVNGMVTTVKSNKLLVFLALASLVAVAGLRRNIGDTFFYRLIYEQNEFTWEFIQSQKDIGFGMLQMLLKNYVSEDSQIMIFTTALITNILIVTVLYKYSRMIDISLYVYITGGLFVVSMNGIRQALAAAIAFTAIKFIINGNWKLYFLIIIVASFFHQSVLVLLPIYYLVRLKAWSKATVALIIFSIIIVIGYDRFSTILFAAIEDTQYGGYRNFAEGGANIIRVVVDFVPIAIAYIGRHKLKKIFPESDYIVNMALLGFVFMVIATQNWIFARFSMYFGLYQLILISWIVKLFRPTDQKLIYYVLIICYFGYFFYENIISLNLEYRSDYLNWFMDE